MEIYNLRQTVEQQINQDSNITNRLKTFPNVKFTASLLEKTQDILAGSNDVQIPRGFKTIVTLASLANTVLSTTNVAGSTPSHQYSCYNIINHFFLLSENTSKSSSLMTTYTTFSTSLVVFRVLVPPLLATTSNDNTSVVASTAMTVITTTTAMLDARNDDPIVNLVAPTTPPHYHYCLDGDINSRFSSLKKRLRQDR